MSQREQLNLYIRQVQQRLRLDAGLRGAAVVACAALAATVVLTLILNAYAFPEGGLDAGAAGAAGGGGGGGVLWAGVAVVAADVGGGRWGGRRRSFRSFSSGW